MNIWSYLLAGLTDLFAWVLNMLPIGNVNPILGTAAAILYFGVAPLLIFVGSFVSLQLFMSTLGIGLVLEGVRYVLAGIRLVWKLIPALN